MALVVAVLAVAIYFSTISPGAMQAMQSTFMSLLSPFLRTGSAVQENIGSVGRRLQTLDELEVENKKLSVENRELRADSPCLAWFCGGAEFLCLFLLAAACNVLARVRPHGVRPRGQDVEGPFLEPANLLCLRQVGVAPSVPGPLPPHPNPSMGAGLTLALC